MAGKGVVTWVKVKTKSGLVSRSISLKDGGGEFEKWQTITESEFNNALKRKDERLSKESKPLPPMVTISVKKDNGRPGYDYIDIKNETAKELNISDGIIVNRQQLSEIQKRDAEVVTSEKPPMSKVQRDKELAQKKAQQEQELSDLKSNLKTLSVKERNVYLVEWVKQKSSGETLRKEHGMTEPERMTSIEVGGVKFSYLADNPDALKTAAKTIKSTVLSKIPVGLSKHTKEIILTSQRNKDDLYWQKIYKTGFFLSSATGGDGKIVIYRGNSADTETISHEMGHNLAKAVYGDPRPPNASKFFGVVNGGKEPPPSDYGKSNVSEDFAESAKFYVKSPLVFKRNHPERYKIIKDLIEKGVE